MARSKFDNAHAEIRLFIPLDSELLQDFKNSRSYQLILREYLKIKQEAQKKGA